MINYQLPSGGIADAFVRLRHDILLSRLHREI
jgi:hypothetical protein